MILTVVGDVDPIHVLDIARSILPREGGPVIERDYGAEPMSVAEKDTVTQMEVAMPQFLTGYKCDPVQEGEEFLRTSMIGDLACEVLLGESSPLYLRLYEQGIINGSFGGSYEMMPGVAYLYAGGDGKDPQRVAEEIAKEAIRLSQEGPDKAFYERLRRAMFGSMLKDLNSFEHIAILLTEGYFHGFDAFRFPEIFESIREEDITNFIRTNITADRNVMSRILPRT